VKRSGADRRRGHRARVGRLGSTRRGQNLAALSRLHGLVSQLNDRATPQLIDAITRSMAKLTTVPFALGNLATLPVIAAESRLRELTMG